MRSPYPWPGGKSKIADAVWKRFGDVPNYVEPFFGSGAVLLARPHEAKTETVNDLDCYLANFWRAVQADPEAVARYADWPVNEADLQSRHLWLVRQSDFRERMKADPDHFDAKIAGWWVWGLCSWIGTGWCRQRGNAGRGVHRKLPHLGDAGRGVHRKLPHLGDAGRGIQEWFEALRDRTRRVRVACGDWTRVLGPSVTWRHGTTAVFLDPPYDDGKTDYSAGSRCSADVRAWALENGSNPKLRIALCGYEGEHDMPQEWECLPWKARGGYGNQRKTGTNNNSRRERIWFSPACLRVEDGLKLAV
jgi:DNA adenine methylase